MKNVVFEKIRQLNSSQILAVVQYVAPDGQQIGSEWVTLNPTRHDKNIGSFKINIATGRWADFATGERGVDLTSFCAYIKGFSQSEAGRFIVNFLGGVRHD